MFGVESTAWGSLVRGPWDIGSGSWDIGSGSLANCNRLVLGLEIDSSPGEAKPRNPPAGHWLCGAKLRAPENPRT